MYDVSCSFEMSYFFKFKILVLRITNLMTACGKGRGRNYLNTNLVHHLKFIISTV